MASKLDKKAVDAEIDATRDDFFAARRDEYLPLVAALQRAASPADYMRLQLELRDRFAAMQDAMDLLAGSLAADKAELRRLARCTPRPQAALDELRRRISIRERAALRNDVLVHVLRCLADAMLWRATGYDRALFTVLGDGTRVGRFPAELGAAAERGRAQTLWDEGKLPFFNDMTNCLRVGDLTVLHGSWPATHIVVEEVKRDGRARPNTRQAKRLDRKLALLQTGAEPLAVEGEGLTLLRLAIPQTNYLDRLAQLLAQARRDGYAQTQPHPALVVSAIDLSDEDRDRLPDGNWMFRGAERLGWTPDDGRHFSNSALVTRMRERQHASSGYHAPIGIFPLCAEDVIDLLMG